MTCLALTLALASTAAAADCPLKPQQQQQQQDSDAMEIFDIVDGELVTVQKQQQQQQDSDGDGDDGQQQQQDSDDDDEEEEEAVTYPHKMTLKEAYTMNTMLGLYVFATYTAEFEFNNGDISDDDWTTVIGHRLSDNTCEIEIDTEDSSRLCIFSNKPRHDITLKYDANVKLGSSYSGACQLIQTCDEGEGADVSCPCKQQKDITEDMVKAFCHWYSSDYTFLTDKGALCAVRASDGAYQLYDKKHIGDLKAHHKHISFDS
eukprot:COSAG01_NODE_17585_length_1139_cov_1.300962_1_plen_261_part_10